MDKIKDASIRIGLWFASFVAAVLCFSLAFGYFSLDAFVAWSFVTLLIAWPAWCLYLPIVIAFKDAEKWRIWVLLSSGVLVGPLSLVLWDAAARLHGGVDAPILGLRDPLNVMGGTGIVFAIFVGSLTTGAYVFTLKLLHDRAGRTPCD